MILVVGATGKLGSTVTRMLLAQGQPVRILARSQSNYQPLADLGAQVVPGDLKQRSSLDALVRGQTSSSRPRALASVVGRTRCRRWTGRAIAI